MLSQNLTIWNWLRMRPPSLEEFQWELFDSLAEQLVMGGDPASSSDIHPVTFKSSDLESQVWCLIGTDAREGNGTPLQYSCLENPMDGGAWWAAVLGVAKSQRRLSDFTFTFHFHASEKEMATHSSILAWRIPGTGEPGGLPSMGSHRVGHD